MFLETFWRHGFAKEYYLSKDEIKAFVTEVMQFISGLKFTLTQNLPQEKLAALRQCIERIHINKSNGRIKMQIREVPIGIHSPG